MIPRRQFLLFLFGMLVGLASLRTQTAEAVEPLTWPQPRGPEWNRISRERNIPLNWSEETATVADQRQELWRISGLQAETMPLVFNGKVYLLYQLSDSTNEPSDPGLLGKEPAMAPRKAEQALIAWYVTGRDPEALFRLQLPTTSRPDIFPQTHLVGDPTWRQLYCLTRDGLLIAYDSDLGYPLWRREVMPRGASSRAARQVSAVPVIFEHLVLLTFCHSQDDETTITCIALDRRNGLPVWSHSRVLPASQVTPLDPVPATINDQVVFALPEEQGIELLQIRTGKSVANLPLSAPKFTPREILYRNRQLLVLSSSNEKEVARNSWRIDLWNLAGQRQRIGSWELPAAEHWTSLLHDETFYAAGSSGELLAFEQASREPLHRLEIPATGPHRLQWVEQQLLLTTGEGEWRAFQCRNRSCRLMDSRTFEGALPFLPAIADKRIYLVVDNELRCHGPFDIGDAISELITPLSKKVDETASQEPGHLQVVPSQVILKPGRKQSFQLLLYNEKGSFLGKIPAQEAEWNWEGPGEMDVSEGTLALPPELTEEYVGETLPLTVSHQQLTGNVTVKFDSGEFEIRRESSEEP